MANKIINTDFITAIANAIRQKLGTSDPISIANMPSSIESIPSGGESKLPSLIDRSVTTLTASDFGNITEIGSYIFNNCAQLTSVTLPNTITKLKDHAFYNCKAMESINLPDSITTIETYCFGFAGIKNLQFPNSLKDIVAYMCYSCASLESITLPNSITNIGQNAFTSCSKLNNVIIPNSVTYINNYAFSYCSSLKTITLSEALTGIPAQCFSSCSALEKITIPASVTEIQGNAFLSCTKLKTIHIKRETPGTVATNAWPSTIATIYVPVGTKETYKTTGNWVKWADKIKEEGEEENEWLGPIEEPIEIIEPKEDE